MTLAVLKSKAQELGIVQSGTKKDGTALRTASLCERMYRIARWTSIDRHEVV